MIMKNFKKAFDEILDKFKTWQENENSNSIYDLLESNTWSVNINQYFENTVNIEEKVDILKQILYKIWIDYSNRWIKPWTKTIKQLLQEIVDKDCLVYVDIDKREIFRKLEVVWWKIFYEKDKWNRFYLYEEKQVFNNWTVKKRAHRMCNSFSEKKEIWEWVEKALERWIREELWIDSSCYTKSKIDTVVQKRYSNSRPGILTQYKIHSYIINFSKKAFDSDGYKEVQSDKTTYFKWIEEDKAKKLGYLD